MSAIFKLVVGDRVEFDVKFTLNDAGEQKHFGMRMSALRQERDEQERDLSTLKVQEFLAARGVTLVSWVGRSPLQDEAGAPVPPCPEALAVIYDRVVGAVSLVFSAYLRANSASGVSGN